MRVVAAAAGLALCLVGLTLALVAPREQGAASGLDGAQLFTAKGCAGCHGVTFGAGPPLVDVATWAGERVDGMDATAYLGASIRDPGAFRSPAAQDGSVMPQLVVTDAEVDRLVTYLLTR